MEPSHHFNCVTHLSITPQFHTSPFLLLLSEQTTYTQLMEWKYNWVASIPHKYGLIARSKYLFSYTHTHMHALQSAYVLSFPNVHNNVGEMETSCWTGNSEGRLETGIKVKRVVVKFPSAKQIRERYRAGGIRNAADEKSERASLWRESIQWVLKYAKIVLETTLQATRKFKLNYWAFIKRFVGRNKHKYGVNGY